MIKTEVFGETGENPVRARRREAYINLFTLPKQSHSLGTSHWIISEKAGGWNAKSKYPDTTNPLIM